MYKSYSKFRVGYKQRNSHDIGVAVISAIGKKKRGAKSPVITKQKEQKERLKKMFSGKLLEKPLRVIKKADIPEKPAKRVKKTKPAAAPAKINKVVTQINKEESTYKPISENTIFNPPKWTVRKLEKEGSEYFV